ncbi:MAG: GAF domain-containing protein [Chloroflexi bacterium]|nr:GAF domain-containing protein [Chloroflexota bacterium]
MSSETLIHRAQAELIAVYKGLADLMALAHKLPDPAVATQTNTVLAQMKTAMDKLQTRINDQDKEHQQVRGLFNIGRAINSTLEIESLLNLVIEMITSVTGAERAFLMLSDSETGQLSLKIARGIDKVAQANEDFQISRSIADRVAKEHVPVLTTNAQEDTRFKASQSIISFSLRSILCVPLRVKDKTIGVIYADNRVKSGIFSTRDRDLLAAFADQAAVAIENARLFAETNQRLRELSTLLSVGQVITRSLDQELVLKTICEQGLAAIANANKIVIHLLDASGEVLEARAIASKTITTVRLGNLRRDQGLSGAAMKDRHVISVRDTQTDPRFINSQSTIRSLVVAPLIVGDRVLGTVTADAPDPGMFDESTERLLAALADQAAIAIENARLFGELRRNIAEVSALKSFQDNIFASIASGVITVDMQDRITTFNRAAELILNTHSADVLNRPLVDALEFIGRDDLSHLIDEVKQTSVPVIGHESRRQVPHRGSVSLSMSLTTLRDATAQTDLGVAIVVDDLTEKRKLQAREEMFGRYLAPSVIKRLPDDPSELKLGGHRETISVLFADVRGYSTFSEGLTPETLVDVLNQYLSLGAQAILGEEGTLDKFMGDAIMAFWNAPEAQHDHALRAVRAAWHMRESVVQHQQEVGPSAQLQFGLGLNVGDAVVGNIGAERALNYTAIGDSVNLAKRLQEGAAGNQIVLSDAIYQMVQEHVEVAALEAVHVKGRAALEKRWELMGLKAPQPIDVPGLPH